MKRTGCSFLLSAFFHFILLVALSLMIRDARPNAFGAVMRVTLGGAAESQNPTIRAAWTQGIAPQIP